MIGPDYSWLLPTALVLAVTLFGYDSAGIPHPWNITSTAPTPSTIGLCAALFLAGLGSWNALRYRGARQVP